ncbi:MAG: hypothetical protein ACLP8A_09975 [Methylovirgula sp.]
MAQTLNLRTAPSDEDVRAALERIVGSEILRPSQRLISFLRFVVEGTLDGHAEHIKGYTIAIEALGRDKSFDPQTNPLVRVEAGRLRHALESYYDGPGQLDPVEIKLPLGSYVPIFTYRSQNTSQHAHFAVTSDGLSVAQQRLRLIAFGALIVAVSTIISILIDYVGLPCAQMQTKHGIHSQHQ